MNIENLLIAKTLEAIEKLYQQNISQNQITIQKTIPIYREQGDFTVLVFPFVRISKTTPEATAQAIGEYLKNNLSEVESFGVIKGFLNLIISNKYWLEYFYNHSYSDLQGFKNLEGLTRKTYMIEYSSPNTNKPLHLGHIRNNLLGWSVAEILKANGHKVIKVNLVNDRGVHICKSMLAYKKYGNDETPETSGMKGDKLVGKYYVEFDKKIYKPWAEQQEEEDYGQVPEISEMLQKWEAGDRETLELWGKMNGWVYKGFDETYKKLGVDFDKIYYESETYLLGKKIVEDGVNKEVLEKRNDGSVWINLTKDGLDEKLLLRSDGTSVYMTQDLGTAVQRASEYHFDNLVYVVGNEQDYHFKVLKLILKKLGYAWADGIYHLSYGMVELPDGKMKSREGTVVDADDLIDDMIDTARKTTLELGKANDLSNEAAEHLYKTIGLGALKYFILKVDPKKQMLFNPAESIDFNGNTGPFIQYTFARIQSVLRKAHPDPPKGREIHDVPPLRTSKAQWALNRQVEMKEKELIKLIYEYPSVVREAGVHYSPALVANFVYELVKEYNQFYHELPILKEEDEEIRNFRITLSMKVGEVIKSSMKLLGIEVPQRM